MVFSEAKLLRTISTIWLCIGDIMLTIDFDVEYPSTMPERDEIIKTIARAYQRPYADQLISQKEILDYIKSVHFLEDILQFSRTAFLVVECKRWEYLYCSGNAKDVMGWEADEFMQGGPQFGLTRLVPEDLEIQSAIHPFMIDYLNKVAEEDKPRYKFSFTSRLRKKNGQVVNLLQHNFFLKSDADNQARLKLITFTDVSAYKNNADIMFYITRSRPLAKNEVVLQKSFSRATDPVMSNPVITERELAILNAAALGLSNFSIAENMGISIHTVKNHKKNISRKLGCANSSQMITLATLYGLIVSQLDGDVRCKISQNS
jgi:DNA-binding CsgD family transcriptional regulator/PAS domain-containing protein